jgi:hypothetical protein
MTNIIAYTDFKGDLNLYLDSGTGGQAQIVYYITELQKELLTKLFGRKLYAFLDSEEGATKLTELTSAGINYYNYKAEKWLYPGLKRMLACYVYFKWQNLEWSSSTTEGETVSTSANGQLVENIGKQVRIWNEMRRLYYEVINYIQFKNSTDSTYFDGFKFEDIEEINTFGI